MQHSLLIWHVFVSKHKPELCVMCSWWLFLSGFCFWVFDTQELNCVFLHHQPWLKEKSSSRQAFLWDYSHDLLWQFGSNELLKHANKANELSHISNVIIVLLKIQFLWITILILVSIPVKNHKSSSSQKWVFRLKFCVKRHRFTERFCEFLSSDSLELTETACWMEATHLTSYHTADLSPLTSLTWLLQQDILSYLWESLPLGPSFFSQFFTRSSHESWKMLTCFFYFPGVLFLMTGQHFLLAGDV